MDELDERMMPFGWHEGHARIGAEWLIPKSPGFSDEEKEAFLHQFAEVIKVNLVLNASVQEAVRSHSFSEYLVREVLVGDKWAEPDAQFWPDFLIDDYCYLPQIVKVYFAPALLRYLWFTPANCPTFFDLRPILRLVAFGIEQGMLRPEVLDFLAPICRIEPFAKEE